MVWGRGERRILVVSQYNLKKCLYFLSFLNLESWRRYHYTVKEGSMESVLLAVIAMTRHPYQFLDSNCRILGVLVEIWIMTDGGKWDWLCEGNTKTSLQNLVTRWSLLFACDEQHAMHVQWDARASTCSHWPTCVRLNNEMVFLKVSFNGNWKN